MSARLKRLAVMLLAAAVLLSLVYVSFDGACADEHGGEIDVYTQKEPYNGMGPNNPSDAYSPEETVRLYALVTYNEAPLQNMLVAFDVRTPSNASFSLSARTDAIGIASTNFTILTPPINMSESEIFGEWSVLADVLIGDKVCQDTLDFRVDWIVKLLSVRAIDENLTQRTFFGSGGDVGLEIMMRSIAMTVRNATITIVIQDELGVPVNFSDIRDFRVLPNEKIVLLYCKLQIPKWAHIGKATVHVSAFKTPVYLDGVPYCPEIVTEFYITLQEPLKIAFRDVAAIEIIPSTKSIEIGQRLYVSVVVQNEGTEIENFDVDMYLDGVFIGRLEVDALSPYFQSTLNFSIDTLDFAVSNYTITVNIPYLSREADLTDNTLVGEIIEIRYRMYLLNVDTDPEGIVAISGEGWYEEYTNVSLTAPDLISITWDTNYKFSHWDVDGIVQQIGVNSINVFMNTNHTATAHYNQVAIYELSIITTAGGTTDPVPGTYNYTADSIVQVRAKSIAGYFFNYWEVDGVRVGSTNPYSIRMDKNHTIKAVFSRTPGGEFLPDWFLLFVWLVLLLFALALLLVVGFYRRRKKSQQSFYSGWTAWFYCYDLRKRTRDI